MNKKRSITINGHKTSISLEPLFWNSLHEISVEQRTTIASIVTNIEASKDNNNNLSSAIRVYVLDYYKKLTELKVK